MKTTSRSVHALICFVLSVGFLFGGLSGRHVTAQDQTPPKKKLLNRINTALYHPQRQGLNRFTCGIKVTLMYKFATSINKYTNQGSWPVITLYYTFTWRGSNSHQLTFERAKTFKIANDMAYGYTGFDKRSVSRFKDISTERFIREYKSGLKIRLNDLFSTFVVPRSFRSTSTSELAFDADREQVTLIENRGYPRRTVFTFDARSGGLREMTRIHPELPPYPYGVSVPVTKYSYRARVETVGPNEKYLVKSLFSNEPEYGYGDVLEDNSTSEDLGLGSLYEYKDLRTNEIRTSQKMAFRYRKHRFEGEEEPTEFYLPARIVISTTENIINRQRFRFRAGGRITDGQERKFRNTFSEYIVLEPLVINDRRFVPTRKAPEQPSTEGK